MSMTIERTFQYAAAVAAILAAWAVVLLALPFLGSPGRQAAIVGDPRSIVPAVVAAGGQILEVKGSVTLARSERPGFAAALYSNGALLVLEGRTAAGCLRS